MLQQISSGEIQTRSLATQSSVPSGRCCACSYCSHSTQQTFLELAHKRWNWASSSRNGLQGDYKHNQPHFCPVGGGRVQPSLLDRLYGWFGRGCSHTVPVLAGISPVLSWMVRSSSQTHISVRAKPQPNTQRHGTQAQLNV